MFVQQSYFKNYNNHYYFLLLLLQNIPKTYWRFVQCTEYATSTCWI